jgi:hypothetical protein
MEEKKLEDLLADVKDAIESPTIPKIYMNGFINSYGPADVVLVIQQNGKSMVVLNMSYTTAKTLAEKFNALIKRFEQQTGHEIMSIDTVKAKIEKEAEKGELNANLG